jgi:uncharacterized membrane protein YdcZ (DUF606 family)
MTKYILSLSALALGVQLYATDSFNSEMSHAVGGAVMAGGITAVVDQYYPEYREERGMMGFGISSAAIVAYQIYEYAEHGNAGGQMLDAAAHIAGSAVGAYLTDKFILSPVVSDSPSEGRYVGMTFGRTF